MTDPSLPEYAGNPFIAALPPPLGTSEAFTALMDLPGHDPKERGYPAHLRCHCVQRHMRYFDPLSRHLELESRIGFLIRQGYIGRNPETTDYIQRLRNNHERVLRRDLHVTKHPVETTASGFALIGCSGIGKSRSVDRILRLYPQTVAHEEPFALVQVPWLKLDCPHKGSAKQLCISFFNQMDQLLGTRYQSRHGSARIALDEMVVHMAQIADRHALGLLVIDEIQHLTQAPGASRDDLLNFLVTLIKKIGLPVMIIGTPAARSLLQGAFRQARRASGIGSAVWEPFLGDGDWDSFVERMWAFQWTREETPLSDELRTILLDEIQGIVDIVIKLYVLTQLRAILLGELKGRPERIDVGLVRHVARNELSLVAPMLDALRKGDQRALQQYDDLVPLGDHVQQSLSDAVIRLRGAKTVSASAAPLRPRGLTDEALIGMLKDLDVAGDVAAILLTEIRAELPDAGPLEIVAAINDRLTKRGPNTPKTKPKPQKKSPAQASKAGDPLDLRLLLAATQDDPHAAFLKAG